MKIALCFIISYEHIVNKENIWREWIEPNKDIINVYFYYKDIKKIKSEWILKHTIPPNNIFETSYYHVIPAYLSLMRFAMSHDTNNQWCCMLTDSCCPIISPEKFRYLFYNYYNRSIISWKTAWWNINYHKRANLELLPKEFHLANDPWFVIKRENIYHVLNFVKNQPEITKTICNGGLANESIFAIILNSYKQLNKPTKNPVLLAITHMTDWSRMTSSTSPHLFKDANDRDLNFIDDELKKNKFVMFIRKISPEFPDEVLRHYIYDKNKDNDNQLVIKEPRIFIYNRYKNKMIKGLPYLFIFIFLYYFYYFL
jgi:hypothetical protein